MNWKAVDEQDVRRLAKDRFGDVLRHDTISFDDLCEEMEFYDKLQEVKLCRKKLCANTGMKQTGCYIKEGF